MPDPLGRDWLTPIGPRKSASSTTTTGDKTRGRESRFSPGADTSPLVTVNSTSSRTPPSTGSLTGSADRRTTRPVRSVRGRQREASTARQRSRAAASSPERSAGANRRSHEVDQPEAAPCGPTRKGDRTRDDHREDRPDDGGAVPSRRRSAALHLTFVRTTQEPLYTVVSGDNTEARCPV